ncbi:Ferrous iron transport protein B [Nocardioides dokdonensis FR1436]|uniref:Ferrous iron transport protein B n=1 Tax=Nocardioides dokdonensis FR1436 TaxID=1300347 RepID=A0A1A9GLG5_9ACTN|nr:FeoB small GTPase domain-containing protein [Nocardioides dokdonensis]ANH38530.1 Ferrous iron transport protein B [Nocardioides dokdonensis FR1436]
MRVDLPMLEAGTGAVDHACGGCALNGVSNLKKFGLATSGCDVVVALAGNPNTGKSTVFNALTGLRQHVGNWPGTTVARAEGAYGFNERSFKVVDLPGTYSLLAGSRDEEVSRDFLLFGEPDATVVVVDATRLERNLNLVLQILQVTDRVVVALNLMDEARRHRTEIDLRHLTRALGVPVVPMVARRGEGLPELMAAIAETVGASPRRRRRREQRFEPVVSRAIDELAGHLVAGFPGLANARWVALRLLEGDPGMERAVRNGTLGELAQQQARRAAS